jgi:hypothetical protein
MLQHVSRLRHAKLGVAWNHDRADARAGEQQQCMTDVITRQHADAIAFAYAAADEQACRLRHRRAEISPAPRLAPEENERTAGIAPRPALERAVQRVVVLRVEPQNFERAFHFERVAARQRSRR